jgi:hypothetical protein
MLTIQQKNHALRAYILSVSQLSLIYNKSFKEVAVDVNLRGTVVRYMEKQGITLNTIHEVLSHHDILVTQLGLLDTLVDYL